MLIFTPSNKFQITDREDCLEIVWAWRGWKTFVSGGAILITWLYILLSSDPVSSAFEFNEDNATLFVATFLVGYYSVASFFNKTYIFADRSKIEIRHHPVPWPGDLKRDMTDISQFYVKHISGYWDEGIFSAPDSNSLRAETKAGKKINIVSELDMNENELTLVKDKLETFLHIDN